MAGGRRGCPGVSLSGLAALQDVVDRPANEIVYQGERAFGMALPFENPSRTRHYRKNMTGTRDTARPGIWRSGRLDRAPTV